MSSSKLVFAPLSYTGWGSLENLLPEVRKAEAKRILIVTDPQLVEIGLTRNVTVPLEEEGFDITLYTEVVPEPPLSVGEQLVAFTREGGFDLVLGMGGGSALDLAKMTAVLSQQEGRVEDYLNLSGTKEIQVKGLPKILIPTTAGTGSEVTNIAVLSLDSTKDVVTHDNLLADVAIIDPKLTLTVPPKVTAATGIDALTHAVEAYVSINASPSTDALALHAIKLIGGSIRTAVRDGSDRQARIDMSYGSYIAGLAFFNAGVAGVHALAYPLGGQFHISHGESNAVLLPYVMGYIRKSCEGRMADVLEAIEGRSNDLSKEEASRKCVEELVRIVRDVGIPQRLSQFDIPESALEELTKDGVKQKRLLARSPMVLEEADIHRIYQAAYDGEVVEGNKQ
ncbi:iron-containing alcohol dehydrogenase [Rossellomorea marisflavi]|uniref:iron-containing alcohol dehydrogenase n=1 Tax=Rossellomorea marisflavi TaxID=189381 RepID=UPI00064F8A60|nr:iron-containing alcohol dehydrogenase [Rossellomorea marisflavi]KMK95228.1 alcohol dehydrogenase [Rossellomorea marisflavi]KML08307.1 alcohol dehydrogenase [Rossellomorea marisflavi]KML31252.1 alcohol dehydrogenase [Rossellomorea marisflavi]